MKAFIYVAFLLPSLILLGSCSKEKVEPASPNVVLDDTEWRLTSQVQEEYIKGTSTKYLRNEYIDCFGNNTITFTASGQVLWTKKADYCSYFDARMNKTTQEVQEVWGQWELKNAPHQLRIVVKNSDLFNPKISSDESALPVVGRKLGAYDISELSATKMVLSTAKVFSSPRQDDSVFISYSTFSRVKK